MPFKQQNGKTTSLGFRFGNVAYCTDDNAFPEESLASLHGLDVLVIDALQYEPHHSHFSLADALVQIDFLKPKRAILTHMHLCLDYETVLRYTPDHVEPAFDGMTFCNEP